MKRLLTISLAVFLALGVSIVPLPINEVFAGSGIIYYVDASATTSGGTSWENAYTDLQDVLINNAVSGDEIWVAEGTYKPTDGTDRADSFDLVSGVALYGGFAGTETSRDQRDWEANLTILSGDIGTVGDNSDNSYHVVESISTIGVILDGFTITGGNATGAGEYKRGGGMYNKDSSPTVTNCTFSGNSVGSAGAGSGMYNGNSSPTVTNCTFSGNSGRIYSNGGGMSNGNSSPTVTDCDFSGNSASNGGGMYNYNSSPTVTGCTFSGNSVGSSGAGGGMYNDNYSSPTVTGCTFSGNLGSWQGSGMYNDNSSPMVTGCTFSENSASNGGGMYNENYSSPTVTDCTFSENSSYWAAGGMYNNSSSPTVTNCTFFRNSTKNEGGGMYNDSSSPTVTGCIFSGNSAGPFGDDTSWDGYGGGMYNYSSSPTVTGCTFSGNLAGNYGGGMYNSYSSSPTVTDCTFSGNLADTGGSGMSNYKSSPTVTGCIFSGNSASPFGGGMLNNQSSPEVTDCTFSGNSAGIGGGMFNSYSSSPMVTNCIFSGNLAGNYGGGMYNSQSSPMVTNCVFSGNSAVDGGGMFNSHSSLPTVTNCTFSGNSATNSGGGMYNRGSSPTVTNCILWNNSPDQINNDESSIPVVSYSDVHGYIGGDGNIDADPLFADPINGDFHLLTGSPCIDTGNNDAPFLPDFDFEGNPRIMGVKVDMGVDEFAANQPPVAENDNDATDEDTAVTISVLANDSDPDEDDLIVSEVTQGADGSVAISEDATSVTYTPNADFNGEDSFTYTASDGKGGTATATVTVTVTAINDAPVADDQSVTTDEDTSVDITLTASDIDEDILTYTVVTQPTHGSLSGTAPDLTYTPDADYNGDDSFTFKANDGTVDSNVATVSITVDPINDAPVANNQSVTTGEDTSVDITLTASDIDEDILTYTVVTQPTHGSLSGTAPDLTYTPDADYNGDDSFTFKANDGTVDSNVATVSITVDPINDAPVANNQSVTTGEDTSVDITLTASDAEEDTLTYTVVTQPTHGSLSGEAPDLTYTPDADYNGDDSFTFKANDGTVDSNVATVSITVDPINDAPVANNQSVTTGEDTSVDITLTASDAEEDTLTYTVVTQPTHGSLSGTAPDLTYAPNADYNGDDSFTYKANDGTDDSNIATVSITVNPVVIEVTIDIKPGSDPNSINLKSKGVVPVVVLTTDSFDAGEVDPATVVFAGAEPERWTSEDVDGDGDLDLLFHFRTQELNLTEDSEDATLTGKTTDGHEITGTDSVRIVPQKGKK